MLVLMMHGNAWNGFLICLNTACVCNITLFYLSSKGDNMLCWKSDELIDTTAPNLKPGFLLI